VEPTRRADVTAGAGATSTTCDGMVRLRAPTIPPVRSAEDQPCALGSLAVVVNDSVYVDGALPEAGVYFAHVSC
jgi:hypothetical protein